MAYLVDGVAIVTGAGTLKTFFLRNPTFKKHPPPSHTPGGTKTLKANQEAESAKPVLFHTQPKAPGA
jgi:hypothetical protein